MSSFITVNYFNQILLKNAKGYFQNGCLTNIGLQRQGSPGHFKMLKISLSQFQDKTTSLSFIVSRNWT